MLVLLRAFSPHPTPHWVAKISLVDQNVTLGCQNIIENSDPKITLDDQNVTSGGQKITLGAQNVKEKCDPNIRGTG